MSKDAEILKDAKEASSNAPSASSKTAPMRSTTSALRGWRSMARYDQAQPGERGPALSHHQPPASLRAPGG